jgi:glutathionylspermidine synthase
MKLLWKRFDPFLADITQLRIQYNDKCYPVWSLLTYDVSCLFNLYPKEWMITESTNDVLLKYDLAKLRSIEPWWKLVASNKGMLPLLY